MKRSHYLTCFEFVLSMMPLLLLVGMMAAQGQAPQGQKDTYSNRSRAIRQSDSRAEQEAERMVSLPADKIITLLQQEPGLFLQVKKMLVRKAYEQGRLLDPDELSDEVLFRLITRDENIRVLVTQEIVDRNYIRAKPTRDEVEQDRDRQDAFASVQANQPDLKNGMNQEDSYWSRQDVRTERSQQQPGQSQAGGVGVPSGVPSANPPADPRRQVEQAKAQSQPQLNDEYNSLPLDPLGMQRISPDQLSSALSARMLTSSMSSASTPGTASNTPTGMMALNSLPGNPTSYLSFEENPPQRQADNSPQETRDRSIPPAGYAQPDRPVLAHRANPYADVPSLYDLYAQYSKRSPSLERFGTAVFHNGTGNFDQLPMDMPVGLDYVLGPGDGVNIDLSGGLSQRLRRVVDHTGRVALPEVGDVQVSGRTIGDVQHFVQSTLRTQFRDIQADVSLSRLRTIRVYVVGDVERPGAYDISALSTPLNALYEAGGPTSRGSLRILKQFRNKDLVQQVDVYDLLLHGVRSGMQRLESGDTILVPAAGPEVVIEGMVRRPAIYELNREKSLAEVLELAGGVLPSGTLRHVDVERVQAHESRTMLRLDVPETNNEAAINKALEDFAIQDGDKVKISPIIAFADNTVFVDGHVFHPGKYAFRDGMKISDLIKAGDLLPEPYKSHAEIIRLKMPDYAPEVVAFDLDAALTGKNDVVLRPHDTVRIFGRYDFEDPPVVSVTGEVRDPGDHSTNGSTYLRDAVFLAGNTTPDARLDDAQIFHHEDDGSLKVLSVNLSKALAGDPHENIMLKPKDRVIIHKNLSLTDPARVMIEGEVARPGKYPLGKDMTAAQLVRLAGGFKRGAYTQEADLTRYTVEGGAQIVGEHVTVPIGLAIASQPETDILLRDGDVLTIRQLAGWNDVGAMIAVKGEVLHPGTFGINEGDRLSTILSRAGGLRADAYPYGAILERAQVRELEEKNRSTLVRQVQEEGTGLKSMPDLDPVAHESTLLQWKNTLDKLQNTPPAGRLVIHISANVKQWANTPADIQVRAGDVLFIPKKPNFVMVDGAVYNPTAVTFRPNKSAGWYVRQAGGPTAIAKKKSIFVIRADGSVAGGSGGMFTGGALETTLQPGDVVVVPDKPFGGGLSWRNTLQVAQLVSAVGIAVQVARGF